MGRDQAKRRNGMCGDVIIVIVKHSSKPYSWAICKETPSTHARPPQRAERAEPAVNAVMTLHWTEKQGVLCWMLDVNETHLTSILICFDIFADLHWWISNIRKGFVGCPWNSSYVFANKQQRKTQYKWWSNQKYTMYMIYESTAWLVGRGWHWQSENRKGDVFCGQKWEESLFIWSWLYSICIYSSTYYGPPKNTLHSM